MENATAPSESEQPGNCIPLHVALLCITVLYGIQKTKKAKTEAAKLRELLWGMHFQPLSKSRLAFLLLFAAVSLCALLLHAAKTLGPGAVVVVAGFVYIVFRKAGVPAAVAAFLRARPMEALSRSQPSGEPFGPPLPVWILTGFLGSGKTTLVNRLVRPGPDGKTRGLLVVENEVGDTALDAELVIQASGKEENVLLLNGACACCKVRGDLCDLMRDEILGYRVPRGGVEGVIIECSGLADPRAVVQTFLLDDDLRHRLRLREVVAVVDSAHVGQYLCSTEAAKNKQPVSPLARLVEEQIAFASLVLLNKADKISNARSLKDLISRIQRVNATADVMPCTYCDVDLKRAMGGEDFKCTPGAWSPDRALVDIERVSIHVGSSESAVAPPKLNENPEPGVRCVSIRVDGLLDLDAFNRWVLTMLSDFEVLRAKGVLAAAGHDEKLAFQAVHAAFDGTPSLGARWLPDEPRFSQLVVIGCDLREDLLVYGLRRCCA